MFRGLVAPLGVILQERKLVRVLVYLPLNVYDNLVSRAGMRVLDGLRKQGKHNRAIGLFGGPDRKAFRAVYEEIMREAILDWLQKQENAHE